MCPPSRRGQGRNLRRARDRPKQHRARDYPNLHRPEEHPRRLHQTSNRGPSRQHKGEQSREKLSKNLLPRRKTKRRGGSPLKDAHPTANAQALFDTIEKQLPNNTLQVFFSRVVPDSAERPRGSSRWSAHQVALPIADRVPVRSGLCRRRKTHRKSHERRQLS